MEPTLSLPEQVLLLSLNDETGKIEPPHTWSALEAALLAELMLQGRLGLDEKKRILVLDPTPTGDALLDQALERIAGYRQPRLAGEWVGKLIPNNLYPSEPVLEEALSKRLVERGILSYKEEKLLWVIPEPTYPTKDAAPEAQLREQVRAAVLGEGAVEVRLAVLIALLDAGYALRQVFSDAEIEKARPRLTELRETAAAGAGSGGALSDRVGADVQSANILGASATFDLIAGIGSFFI